jgi:hypothetical protein
MSYEYMVEVNTSAVSTIIFLLDEVKVGPL